MIMLNIRFDYRKLRWSLIVYVVFIMFVQIFLILFIVNLQYVFVKQLKIISSMFIFFSTNTMTMFLSQIILLIVSIKQRFEALNFLLDSKTCIDTEELKIASKIHHAMTEVIEAMNESYCKIAMLNFAGVFGFFNLFLFCLKIMIEMFNFECFIVFTGKVLINAYSFIIAMFVIFVSSKASNEAKRTLRIVYEVSQRKEKDPEWNEQLINFTKQIDCSVTRFSCAFFTYDWLFFFKVILTLKVFVIFINNWFYFF